ncbi:Fc.00g077140.m01.CDS01 [Cosmosporella sp. VM-42]
MSSNNEVVQRLKESRPPATDPFTYLTIIEKSLSPEILPTLEEILEDAELTKDIGWDMVEILISVPGSENCLETIARLGNPREVILKVLEVMDKTSEESEAGIDWASKKFITLLGMLSILHRRLQVKAPSRFLQPTLQTVYRAWNSESAEATAAVIDLVRSLSGRKRPVLPTRQSSTKLDTPFTESDPSKSAPDPEGSGQVSPEQAELVNVLLQSFITCIIEAYANTNSMEWSTRLLEYITPERIVPRRVTITQRFREVDELQANDALIGQLVAVAGDLGLSNLPPTKVKEIVEGPLIRNPLSVESDLEHPDDVKISTGGFLCYAAYRMFAADIFDADYDQPDINIFPEHHLLLKHFLGDEPQEQIMGNPGTADALVAMGLWLHDQKQIIGKPSEKEVNFMSYHHLLTLISVFHQSISTRNAATILAGFILHSDPDEDDRLGILEDLLENCMFSSLQACAVTWLREEMISARKTGTTGRFASPSCLDGLQYSLFQDLTHLKTTDPVSFQEYWLQSAPLHLQVANFALFLFGGKEYQDLAPAGMAAAVEHRYALPLLAAAKNFQEAIQKKEVDVEEAGGDMLMNLSILVDALERVPLQ